jgi:phosphoadenosine phosphosulfate reductase
MTSSGTSVADQRRRQQEHDAERLEHQQNRPSMLQPMRSRDELKTIAQQASEKFAEASADEVLAWVAEEFGYRTAVACSMADAVLPDVVANHLPWVDTLFLDTGYHFAETVGTRDAVEATMRLNIVDVTPKRTVEEQDAEFGKDLFARDPGLCCQMRKVEPLAETLDDLIDYASEHDVVINPLINDGYPSIGCAPCTRRVEPGEDPRAGRWAGLDKTECGLHG